MLTLLRHGRTKANASGLLQGRSEIELDDLGHAQAEAAVASLDHVDLVISSPLRRAMQTASYFDAPVQIDDRWAELDYGEFEGRRFSDLPADIWQDWHLNIDFRPPGGETLTELGQRTRSALEELLITSRDQQVVVVTHVSPIKAALAWALGVSDVIAWRCHLGTASITRIEMSAIGPVVHSFNDVSHLPDAEQQKHQTWAEREGLIDSSSTD